MSFEFSSTSQFGGGQGSNSYSSNSNSSSSHSNYSISSRSSDHEGIENDTINNKVLKQNTTDPIAKLFYSISAIFNPLSTTENHRVNNSPADAFSSTQSTDSDQEVNEYSNRTKNKQSRSAFEAYHSDSEQETDIKNRQNRRDVKRKRSETTHISQRKINYICSCLHKCNIKSRQDLIENLNKVIKKINKNQDVFKSNYTEEQCFEMFAQALRDYNRINSLRITFSEGDIGTQQFKKTSTLFSSTTTTVSEMDDLSRITQSYDRLAKAHEVKKSINEKISEILHNQEYASCSHVILGAGDTGVTVWLEKYASHHDKTQGKLDQGQIPAVLVIAEDHGCWSHDYTLAQPHSFLERGSVSWNPSDYTTTTNYEKNAFINGRHMYQANQVVLTKTQAPLLTASVAKIEKRSEHNGDWKCGDREYRLLITTKDGEKTIYTNEVDICTGLGPARKIENSVIANAEFDRLSKFDETKKYTPIVDGNQFMLTGSEEQSTTTPRAIVVYGGGGTGSAAYRKGFFGQDKDTQTLEFTDKNKKNSVIWVAKNLDAAGIGRLASMSIDAAKRRNESFIGWDLKTITAEPGTGKLKLQFKSMDPKATRSTLQVECDQLVYTIGQDDLTLKSAIKEFKDDLQLSYDVISGVPFGLKTSDEKIHFFGSSSMGMGSRNSYTETTGYWLKKENVAPDVGPGTMAPSRAQIRQFSAKKQNSPLSSVNVNSDCRTALEKFIRSAGVNTYVAFQLIEDILKARKTIGFDLNRAVLQGLLDKHALNGLLKIAGHGHLVRK